jgi:hypothetical protein
MSVGVVRVVGFIVGPVVYRAPHCGGRFNKSGSLAMLAAIRRASSRVSTD